MTTRRKELENEGIKSIELKLDMHTYEMLQGLMEQTGYDIENGEKIEAVSGVFTHLIRSYMSEEEPIKLSRIKQRNMILRGQLKYLKEEMGYSDKEIAELFNSKKGVRYTAMHNAKKDKWSASAIARLENNKRIRNKSKISKNTRRPVITEKDFVDFTIDN